MCTRVSLKPIFIRSPLSGQNENFYNDRTLNTKQTEQDTLYKITHFSTSHTHNVSKKCMFKFSEEPQLYGAVEDRSP